MAIEKTLLLKGLAGVAAIGGVGGVAIAHKSGAFKSKKGVDEAKVPKAQGNLEDEDKKNKKESVNAKLTTLGLGDCHLGDNEVTSPTTFSKECDLDQDKFQKIKFSNKPEAGNVTVEGWNTGTNKIKLKIENKENDGIKFLFKDHPSNLTISGGDSQDNKFSIRSGKETEFEEINNKLSKKVDSNIQNKLKGYNQKFESLKLPTSCSFDTTEADTSQECSITKEQLKTINFSNKGENELTINGLDDSQNVKLTIERYTSAGTETLKYKFKNENNSNITVTGTTGDQTKFSIRTNKEIEFEENGNKLSKKVDSTLSTRLKGYNTKFQTLSLPEVCRFDDTESETSFECEMDQNKFKKIKFSNKDENTDLIVKGWTGDNKITLKVEEKEDKSGVKYLFKNIKDNLTITKSESEQTEKFTLKTGVEKEFEEKNSKLSKVVNETLSAKLKKFNSNLGTLGIPSGCRFDDTESDTSLECSISEEQIKTIKFWNKGDSDLTISSGTSFASLKLALSVNGDELKYIFKEANRNIKLSQDNKTFTLKEHADNEFEFKEEVLRRPRKIEEVAGKVNLTCTYDAGSKGNNGSCTLSENYITVSSDGRTPVSLHFGPNSSLKDKKNKVKFDFSEYEYEDNYENNVKFTFKEDTLEDSNGGKLENNANYEVKKVGVSDCLSKKVQ